MRTVVIDLETTGKYPNEAEMIQFAALEFDKDYNKVSSFVTLCQPNRWSDIDMQALDYNGITIKELENAPTSTQVKETIVEYWQSQLNGELIYAHGWNYKLFDGQFLQLFFGRKTYDKMFHYQARDIDDEVAFAIRIGKLNLTSTKLKIVGEYFGVTGYAHDAYADCTATLHCMKKLIEVCS